jgi:hypothetical protein
MNDEITLNRYPITVSLKSLAVFVFSLATSCNVATGESVTWTYTGEVYTVRRNTLGLPSPIGQQVKIVITFDPLATDVAAHPNLGIYNMSGGDNNFQVQVGSRTSTPVDHYGISVIDANFDGTDDQIVFHDPQSNGIPIASSFPGFLDEANLRLFFREQIDPGPIETPALPTIQPNPADFRVAQLWVTHLQSGTPVFEYVARLDPVPEPELITLLITAFVSIQFWFVRSTAR